MRILIWLVVLMTGAVAGATVYQAATEGFGADVVIGFTLSVVGIWILAAVERSAREQ